MTLSTAALHLPATRRDPSNIATGETFTWLVMAQRARQSWETRRQWAVNTYGDVSGNPTSGCYGPHFPAEVKNRLRFEARSIGLLETEACRHWRKAGRKQFTLKPYLEMARRLDDGRRSYY